LSAAQGPLAGITVLDLSRVLAGPWATQLLADLGAEVIKVERPRAGDDTRAWGPPYLQAEGAEPESAYFLSANRGKRSVCIDLSRPAGQDLVRRLAEGSDVMIENFKVGGLARFGLDYASLARLTPRLVYCSISGFGQTGPGAAKPGYDFVVQGQGGLMSVTGAPDGPPTKAGVALADIVTGLYAANAVQAALIARAATGLGQHIDLALLDVQVAVMANQALNYLVGGRSPGRLGNAHPNIVPYQAFATADGDITVAVGNDVQFRSLCAALDRVDLAQDPRFATNPGRVAHRDILVPALQDSLSRRPAQAVLDALARAGVPSGPINGMAEVFEDPDVVARDLRLNLPHTTLGHAPGVACPIRMSGAPVGAAHGPPALGEHTRQVLRERLQLSDAEIDALVRDRVVGGFGEP
jgi:crotonobetainyl-CoA:carnitine CoA-transferase CaiB-like acyl-CoA transferase